MHTCVKIRNVFIAFDLAKRKCSDYRVRRGLSPTVRKVRVALTAAVSEMYVVMHEAKYIYREN